MKDKIEKVKEILLSHGIRINADSPCCDPYFSFEYNGEMIIDDKIMSINMIEEK